MTDAVMTDAGTKSRKTQEIGEIIGSKSLPLIVNIDHCASALEAASEAKKLLGKDLLDNGAILLRGCGIGGIDDFQKIVELSSGESKNYDFGSTPRSKMTQGVYTATEYPPHQTIPLHNEQSYTNEWADTLWFFCHTPAKTGGETPLADSRVIFNKIPESIRRKFMALGVMYVRNYGGGYDLPWEKVFNTENPKKVEEFCIRRGIAFEWKTDGELRTRQVCQAAVQHPVTQEHVWFNQAHLFHSSSLSTEIRETLIELVGEENIPRNAFYGDGSPIEESDLEKIRAVYGQNKIEFAWQKGDLLMIDNVLTAHARNPFEGERKVYVAMT